MKPVTFFVIAAILLPELAHSQKANSEKNPVSLDKYDISQQEKS